MKPHSILVGLGALFASAAASALLAQAPAGGKVAASAAHTSTQQLPRQSDGHPDLNGTWDNGSGIDFLHPEHLTGGSVCVAGCDAPPVAKSGTPPAAGRPPRNFPKYRPQYLAKVAALEKNQLQMDPVLHCRAPGLPRIGPPDKIVQMPGQIVFLYDDVSGDYFRIIPTDGRPHRVDVDPSTLGDSIGHWDGDTLVVEANQFNDDSWLTDNGAFHSTALTVTERLQRVGNTLRYQAVATDPTVLAEPWAVNRLAKLTDVDLVEAAPCVDKDLNHVVDGTHHDNPR